MLEPGDEHNDACVEVIGGGSSDDTWIGRVILGDFLRTAATFKFDAEALLDLRLQYIELSQPKTEHTRITSRLMYSYCSGSQFGVVL